LLTICFFFVGRSISGLAGAQSDVLRGVAWALKNRHHDRFYRLDPRHASDGARWTFTRSVTTATRDVVVRVHWTLTLACCARVRAVCMNLPFRMDGDVATFQAPRSMASHVAQNEMGAQTCSGINLQQKNRSIQKSHQVASAQY
jgi:hypothetical protein